ncbi:3-phosphoshikimate 1-carboxyvinyltransferase [Enterobacteriaceae endosymbiont of Neohaemonia nigricornis]|uniref:3-phosphoshikimate 1-carboxyvinyltransferase n=1 Tax=Enterobacteriaceae endosymbiont of Neohaemonia nigricornis TaxID=2675792 RepID=UPI0014493B50|nr:3-phosphoshikimate 1-carboxyvinyltransferase [Enterobacteriaceae endosymbiont of Neohaemonia nigricornis]QJC30626.1 3-phosphoshikimate 1-carboxyvinyltransferase [Enterobacteriaceae endosymbiont of Neohaemonia nigricornis]
MNNILTLTSIKKISGCINLPGSKSISNRVLLLSALSMGCTTLYNILNCDDTKYMLNTLKICGIKITINHHKNICHIIGNNGIFNIQNKNNTLFLGNAGTVIRPLTALFSANKICNIILTGEDRMKERPIGHLVNTLRLGGAKITYLERENYPPIQLHGGFIGTEILELDGSISSQFLTSLLITAPLLENNTTIIIKNTLVSQPYIRITLKLIKKFGVIIKNYNYTKFYICGNQQYLSPNKYIIEGDASSASYFLSAAAIKGGTVKLNNIDKNSIQGDIKYIEVLKKMGANIFYGNNYVSCTRNILHAISMDMNHIPDVAMTIAVTCLFATGGTTTISNIYNWRVKETDRLHAMAIELRKTGAQVIEGIDYISITPPKKIQASIIETYNDHRMAMCFALLALSDNAVQIINPSCTNKTYPNFFKDFKKISLYN